MIVILCYYNMILLTRKLYNDILIKCFNRQWLWKNNISEWGIISIEFPLWWYHTEFVMIRKRQLWGRNAVNYWISWVPSKSFKMCHTCWCGWGCRNPTNWCGHHRFWKEKKWRTSWQHFTTMCDVRILRIQFTTCNVEMNKHHYPVFI